MFPKYHILFGAIFSFFLWLIYPAIGLYAILVFLATFLIDVDHYLVYVKRKNSLNPKKATNYFFKIHQGLKPKLKAGKKVKAPLLFTHTVEFLLLVFLFSLFSPFFLFILTGFIFHSLLDVIDMYKEFSTIYPRSFSIIHYYINKKKNAGKIEFL